jgi:hypothetical protein
MMRARCWKNAIVEECRPLAGTNARRHEAAGQRLTGMHRVHVSALQ